MTVLSIPDKVEKKPKSEKPTYDQQYCEKHDQRYADFLHACPICVGEELGKRPITVIDYTGTIKGDEIMDKKSKPIPPTVKDKGGSGAKKPSCSEDKGV